MSPQNRVIGLAERLIGEVDEVDFGGLASRWLNLDAGAQKIDGNAGGVDVVEHVEVALRNDLGQSLGDGFAEYVAAADQLDVEGSPSQRCAAAPAGEQRRRVPDGER